MENKGFIFAETLITTAIIFVLLISFYTFSIAFINNQTKYKNYDNVEDIYKLANIRLFLYRTIDNFNEVIDNIQKQNKACISLNNVNYDKEENTNKYNKLKTTFGVKQMYLCDFENDNIDNLNNKFKDYFEYTKKKYKDKYRIISYFDNNKFSSIKVWSVTND